MRVVWGLLVAGCSFGPAIPAAVDGGPDARAVDAGQPDAAWNPGLCPPSYDLTPAGQASRYRIDLRERSVWEHGADCRDDDLGRTHLAVPDDLTEVLALQTLVESELGLPKYDGLTLVWIGGIQLRGETTTGAGWLAATGGPQLDGVWANGEPNDWGNVTFTDNVEDDEEQFAALWRGQTHIADMVGPADIAALCECDGRPIDEVVQGEMDATAPPP